MVFANVLVVAVLKTFTTSLPCKSLCLQINAEVRKFTKSV